MGRSAGHGRIITMHYLNSPVTTIAALSLVGDSLRQSLRSSLVPKLLLPLLGLLLSTAPLRAHPISLSSVIADVQDDQVLVEMQIMLEDLVLYHRLAADGELNYSANDLQQAAKKHRKFVLDYFSIFDSDGSRLVGSIDEELLDQIDPMGVAQTDLMRRSIAYTITYPLKQAKPKFLTFVQNFGGPKAVLPAVMDLHVLHKGMFVEKSTQIVYSRPHTISLDWQRNADGKRATFAEIRKQHGEQLQARLGISSYTGLFSFLYITRFEVRHEILVPLLTLEQWLPIPRRDPDFLDVDEQTALRGAIEQFFRKHNLITVNDQPVDANLTRLNFFSLDINDFALNAEPRRVSVHQARVGVILTFPSSATPRSATVSWDIFTEFASFINSVLLIGNEQPNQFYFHQTSQIFKWTGDLTGPKVAPVVAVAAQLAESDRAKVLQQVLTNVYRAFDFRDDEDVYDALDTSVTGDLLREIYLRIKRSLLMAEQGGALSHATDVQVESVRPAREGNNDVLEAVWRVTGVSEHWGHVHTRVSEYRARLTLVKHADAWKISRFQLVDEKRLKFETSIRGYDPNQ